MSSSILLESEKHSVEVLFENSDDSSIEVPQEEWSSLVIEEEKNIKKILYAEGLYDPGSGEVCAKYIPLSDSDIARHVYYKYPAIVDPGNNQALFGPIPVTEYPDDGQERYLALCEEMSIPVIRSFYRSLLTTKVDLSFYGLSMKSVRTICVSLKKNEYVKSLDLTDNFLDIDACFHIGEMLVYNKSITELILRGCKIGHQGAKALLNFLPKNPRIKKLDISKNEIGDNGAEHVAKAILQGMHIPELNLSNNCISDKGVLSLTEMFEIFTKLTHLNLSNNIISEPITILKLCRVLATSKFFLVLDLSWNCLRGSRIGEAINLLLKTSPSLQYLFLNNNRIDDEAAKLIGKGLTKAKKIVTLDLSFNPLTSSDAFNLLEYLSMRKVKLQNLLLDNVVVDEKFVETREKILALPFRKLSVVTHGHVRPKMSFELRDMRLLLLKRADAIGRSGKKKDQVDFPLVILEIYRDNPDPKPVKEFTRAIQSFGLKLNDDFNDQMCIAFPGPRAKGNVKTISLEAVVDYIKRLWPDKKLPPLPPEPLVLPPIPQKPSKGKGKK
ncbi:uncharacterized protein LOC142987832 [Anticarsia gemmatalis]|uniref:uncharacterized protein LOC142987832 n=1 Tax=Anticarsia gemmatalis TaxID=129554 RepID=UPI003F77179A